MKNNNIRQRIILEKLTSYLLIVLVLFMIIVTLVFITMKLLDYRLIPSLTDDLLSQTLFFLLALVMGVAAINASLNIGIIAGHFASKAPNTDVISLKKPLGILLIVCLLAVGGTYFVEYSYRRQRNAKGSTRNASCCQCFSGTITNDRS